MKAKNLGLKDIPIARADEEALGLTNYADVLRDFVASCDTPITVALQLKNDKDDESLSPAEVKNLRDVLGLSAVVSASVEEYKVNADEFVVNLRRELNNRYAGRLNKQRPRIGKFRYSRSEDEVFLELPKIEWCRFTVQIEEGYLGFGLEAERTDGSLSRVERHFRRELRSIAKVALKRDRYVAWYWQRADSSSAERDLRKSLYIVLDEMLPRLRELCNGLSEE